MRAAVFPGAWTLVLQLLMFGVAALCYFGVRGLTQGKVSTADDNAFRLVEVEQALRLDWEVFLQGLVKGSDALIAVTNWVYIYGHWPVVITSLVVLFVWMPHRYYLLRNALFLSGAIGLLIFALVPMAPPRLGILDIMDTVTERSSSYRAFQPPGLINRYAAMPSLHFGWNLLVGVVLWNSFDRRLARGFVLVMVPAMAFAVVATANHYVLDVVVGGAVALLGLLMAKRLPAILRTPVWARQPR